MSNHDHAIFTDGSEQDDDGDGGDHGSVDYNIFLLRRCCVSEMNWICCSTVNHKHQVLFGHVVQLFLFSV